jgi:microcystin degradation protein MlrC
VYHIEALDESIARAKKLAETAVDGKPVVLLDHYDNCASGGTMDTMAVLDAMIRADLQNAAAFAICDPQAVQTLMKVGVGGEASLMLGGKHALSSLKRPGEPLKVSGRVKTLTDGQYRFRGPMARGERANMGAAAVLQVGGIEIAVISRHVEPFDINTLITLGIDPYSKKFLMLKSRVHWRAGLGELAGAVVECAGVGVCTSDYDSLSFHKVRRPIYPLDPVTSFQQGQVIQGG